MKPNKEVIPYDIAVQLKELGMDYYTNFVYLSENPMKIEKGIYNYPKELFPNRVSAFLYQQVFRWFRDVKNILVNIEPFFNGAIEYAYNLYHLYDEKHILTSFNGAGGSYEGTWYTYEECCIESIKEVIKILKDVG